MYVLRKDKSKGWQALYSHWGADYLRGHIEETADIKDVDAKEELRKFLEELDYEFTEKIRSPSKFIDLSLISIEIWLIDHNNKQGNMYIVLPFIDCKIYGAIVAEISRDPSTNLDTLELHKKYNNYVNIVSSGLDAKVIDKETIRKVALEHFLAEGDYHSGTFRQLVFGKKLPSDVANIIDGLVTRIL